MTVDFIVTYLLLSLIYRISLLAEASQAHSVISQIHVAGLALGLFDDLITGFIILIAIYWIHRLKRVRNIICLLLLSVIAMIDVANKKLFLMLSIHLTYHHWQNAIQDGLALKYIFPLLSISDWMIILFPLLMLIIFRFLHRQQIRFLLYYCVLPGTILAMTYGLVVFALYGLPLKAVSTLIVYSNPVKYMATDFYRSTHNPYLQAHDRPNDSQMHSIAFIDPAFTANQHAVFQKKKRIQWNIVMIVLESVGYSYIFDTSHHNAMPMPFLHSLAQRGLWLTNHYSSGNNSPIGAFGLFSGIYPAPRPTHFVMRPDIVVPNMATWLGNDYDSFFVSPADTRIYFPEAFFKNTGFKTFDNAFSLPLKNKTLTAQMFLDDFSVMDYFLSRLQQAKQPFFAVYWPCATHYPYSDYGHDYHILPDTQKLFARYMNNLSVMDYQLMRIYQSLQKRHLLDKTILIVIGDHGEGFGQHQGTGTWLHGGSLFQEQIKVPALIYQPRVFHPKKITQPTSVVDILPTVLDAMGVHYSPDSMQGESLFHFQPARKYVFVYGEEDEMAAIDRNNVKTQIAFNQGRCVRYDLKHDPYELNALPCRHEVERAMIKFRNYQPFILEEYNQNMLKHFRPK